MLAGLVGVPACASIVGIDTDRYVSDGGLGPTSTPTGTSGTSGTSGAVGGDASSTSSSGNVPTDSGPDASNDCTACTAGGFTTTCMPGVKQCKRTCDATSPCASGTELTCPDGWQCTIDCKNGCQGVSCVGGTLCTLDCTTGNCSQSQCTASVCRYECGQGNQCNGVGCLGANTQCLETCGSGGATKPCKDPIHCCTESGKRQCPADNSVCP